jgi:hypothetical protein
MPTGQPRTRHDELWSALQVTLHKADLFCASLGKAEKVQRLREAAVERAGAKLAEVLTAVIEAPAEAAD